MGNTTLETDPHPIEYRNFSNLEGFITYRIARLHAVLDRQAVDILKNVSGLRQNEWKILLVLGGVRKTLTSKDIAKLIKLDPAIISRTLRSLEDEGYLVAKRSDSDRRTVNLALSAKGRAKFEATVPQMQARQRTILSTLSPEEREMAWSIFDKLENAAEQREFDL